MLFAVITSMMHSAGSFTKGRSLVGRQLMSPCKSVPQRRGLVAGSCAKRGMCLRGWRLKFQDFFGIVSKTGPLGIARFRQTEMPKCIAYCTPVIRRQFRATAGSRLGPLTDVLCAIPTQK